MTHSYVCSGDAHDDGRSGSACLDWVLCVSCCAFDGHTRVLGVCMCVMCVCHLCVRVSCVCLCVSCVYDGQVCVKAIHMSGCGWQEPMKGAVWQELKVVRGRS